MHEQLEVQDAGHHSRGELGEAHIDGSVNAAAGEGFQYGLRQFGDPDLGCSISAVRDVGTEGGAHVSERSGQVLKQLVGGERLARRGLVAVLRRELAQHAKEHRK